MFVELINTISKEKQTSNFSKHLFSIFVFYIIFLFCFVAVDILKNITVQKCLLVRLPVRAKKGLTLTRQSKRTVSDLKFKSQ